MPDADPSDEALMARFRATLDEDVFRVLAERYYGRAVAFAQDRLGRHALACDAVQETLVRVVRHAGRWDSSRPFAPWFFTILRNVCTDLQRKEGRYADALQRFAETVLEPASPRPPPAAMSEWLSSLPAADARLLELRYALGLTVAQVARQLGCSVEAAKKRLQRAVHRLRPEPG